VKAFLLAAGVGSRLRPITDRVPKCMLQIDGRPMLALWLDTLQRAGVDEVLVNVHHLPDVVHRYLQERRNCSVARARSSPTGRG
jgi:mannose-1-phosphate guanylyltransferase